MKHPSFMNTSVLTANLTLAGVAALVSGCAEPRVTYVPVYHVQPAYVVQQPYPPSAAYQGQPASAQASAVVTTNWQGSAAAPAPVATQPPPQTVVVAVPSPPPPAQVEVIPVTPGQAYVWVPGYWSWNAGWIWVGGRWCVRPRPAAVWIGGHWSRYGHGWVWIGGGWR